ncbi:MAG: phenylalanine--tRNA ligase subunit beta [Dehalococcoidia bacterium]
MRISLKWLKEYVDFDYSAEELAEKLTMVGLEVSNIETIGGGWDDILVGDVTKLVQHPNADRLKLATIDIGKESLTVVCGAPNIEEGQKVPLALIGSEIYDADRNKTVALKPAKIRGIVSEGMVCSERELRISDDHEGILVLPSDAAPGVSMDEYLGDTTLEVDATPNRPDWLSMIGVAWEVAAILGKTVKMPDTTYAENSKLNIKDLDVVEVIDANLAPRYTTSIIQEISAHIPSPGWMQLRLKSAGVRPISSVVDITNYVMLEYGQPLHAFDRAKLDAGKVIVRPAKTGEVIETLDGKSYELSTEDLVIADTKGPVGLAGVMGGQTSEVDNNTKEILLESATFHFASIRRTVQRHRLEVAGKRGTEASLRFEKSLPITLPMEALKRATKLLVDICGGTAIVGTMDTNPDSEDLSSVTLTSNKLKSVLGLDYGKDQVSDTLKSLGFNTTTSANGDEYSVQAEIPFWRADIRIPEDLVEEVARIIGYDSIPSTLPSGSLPEVLDNHTRLTKELVKNVLVSLGLQETISYPLVSIETIQKSIGIPTQEEPMRVWNRISPDQEFLRTTLRGSLLKIFARNEKVGRNDSIKIFEISKIYIPVKDEPPKEQEMLLGLIGGEQSNRGWNSESKEMDFFDGKGIIESLLDSLSIKPSFTPKIDRVLTSGRTASISIDGQEIGVIGEVHPDTLDDFEVKTKRVTLFEINVESLADFRNSESLSWKPISRFPGLVRQLDLITDVSTPSGAVNDIIVNFPSVAKSTLLDIYSGSQIPEGQKSLSFEIVWQSPSRTLTDKEVEIALSQLLDLLNEKTNSKLRLE